MLNKKNKRRPQEAEVIKEFYIIEDLQISLLNKEERRRHQTGTQAEKNLFNRNLKKRNRWDTEHLIDKLSYLKLEKYYYYIFFIVFKFKMNL